MAPWEQHRSILREAMIETFIAQRITDPDEWFSKVPQYQRQGTHPAEKARYMERICDLVARLDGKRTPPKVKPPAFELTPPRSTERPHQGSLFGSAGFRIRVQPGASVPPPAAPPQQPNNSGIYATADVAACGTDPNSARFSDPGYLPALTKMVSHV